MPHKDDLFYFAHPYRAKQPCGVRDWDIEKANFDRCRVKTRELLGRGYLVFSPICHSHPIEPRTGLLVVPTAWEDVNFWLWFDELLIHQTDFAGIILAPGWEKSDGCVHELLIFETRGLEVLYYDDIMREEA